ncbi:MAG: succinate dehydrogenase assembly factor 2 [Neisseriaceae bacterium]|nr:succinate dehydrogenase assembly factor 2 [Neisseriaceae bacterium]
MTNALNNYQRKVRWQMRRGLLELNIVFNRFIDNGGFAQLDEQELRILEDILTWNDQDLLQVMLGCKTVEEPFQAALIRKIRGDE